MKISYESLWYEGYWVNFAKADHFGLWIGICSKSFNLTSGIPTDFLNNFNHNSLRELCRNDADVGNVGIYS